MAIRIQDNSSNTTGQLSPALGSFTAGFDGDVTVPGGSDIDGALNRALGGFNVSLADRTKKWNPGHYLQTLRNSTYRTQANRFALYDSEIKFNPNIVGASHMFDWITLEGSQGDYSSGFAEIQAELDYLDAMEKKFFMRFNTVDFNETCATSNHLPSYVQSNGWCYTALANPNRAIAEIWNEATMDAYIAMVEAYGAEFDGHPALEGITPFKETATNFAGSVAPDFSNSKYDTQVKRLMQATLAAFPTTNVVLSFNYYGPGYQQMLDYMLANNIVKSNPDSCDACNIPGDTYFTGEVGTTDYRGQVPCMMSVENSVFSGSVGSGDVQADEVFSWLNDTMQASHIFWDYNTFATSTPPGPEYQLWDEIFGIEYVINQFPVTNLDYPSTYP
jgi:hypothetical protein